MQDDDHHFNFEFSKLYALLESRLTWIVSLFSDNNVTHLSQNPEYLQHDTGSLNSPNITVKHKTKVEKVPDTRIRF